MNKNNTATADGFVVNIQDIRLTKHIEVGDLYQVCSVDKALGLITLRIPSVQSVGRYLASAELIILEEDATTSS